MKVNEPKNAMNALKSVLPRTDRPRRESDVQTILPLGKKPQQVKDFEERSR